MTQDEIIKRRVEAEREFDDAVLNFKAGPTVWTAEEVGSKAYWLQHWANSIPEDFDDAEAKV